MKEKYTKSKEIFGRIYQAVDELEALFPGRKFSPDGHMVGSLGEAIAEIHYQIELYPPSYPDHDAKTFDGKEIQIRATQRKSVGLRKCPQFLLALKLNRDGSFEELFNGSGIPVWQKAQTKKPDKNGYYFLTLIQLRELNEHAEERIPHRVL